MPPPTAIPAYETPSLNQCRLAGTCLADKHERHRMPIKAARCDRKQHGDRGKDIIARLVIHPLNLQADLVPLCPGSLFFRR